MKKVLFVFGTRPEAIKMAPLVKAFRQYTNHMESKVCITAQHRQMLDQVLSFFEIVPDYDLDLMKPNQTLYGLTAHIIEDMKNVLDDFKPEYVFVHGDTTTSMAAALSAFYFGAKVCHVEAGLRTGNKWAPFPEEMNRQITGRLTDLHFAPTSKAKENLLKENVSENSIFVTGNTVIDALLWTQEKLQTYTDDEIQMLSNILTPSRKTILVTGHRRENFGEGFLNICKAIKTVAETHPEVDIVYPVHLNPNVQKPVFELLDNTPNVKLIAPLAYPAFVWLMSKSYLILTDSGGVQEEAPSLGKPVLVMRNTTERPEAVEAGTVKMVGTNAVKITESIDELLTNETVYLCMSKAHNPYGDGKACERIVNYLIDTL